MVSLLLFIIATLLFLNSMPSARKEVQPRAVILPLTKDISTLQHTTHIKQRTPFVDVPLVVDLGGDQSLWVDCETGFKSTSYKVIQCRTAPCSLAKSESCGGCFTGPTRQCYNDSCDLLPNNPVTDTSTTGVLLHDVVSLQSIGERSGQRSFVQVKLSNFLVTCAPSFLLEGLAKGAKGMVGLGRAKIGMPSQFAAAFSFRRWLVLCLGSNGFVLFGSGVRMLHSPNDGVFQSLNYTRLIKNPVTSVRSHLPGYPSSEYFIRLKSIKINSRLVDLNPALLEIDLEGNGGTKLSTTTPYTLMHSSIYKSVITNFKNELANVPTVTQVSPFSLCYNPASLASSELGPNVPTIDFVMDDDRSSRTVHWTIFGANSMVYVTDKVMCLGIVDGGESMKSTIVIGAQQLENYVLEFDLAASRFGFSSSLFLYETTCSSFKFNTSGQHV